MTSDSWKSLEEANADREYVETCLSGNELFGDSFSGPALDDWFQSERQGYANLLGSSFQDSAQTRGWKYGYHGLNVMHAFRHLRSLHFDLAVSIGGFDGSEVLPIANQISELVIVEPASDIPECPEPLPPHRQLQPQPSGNIDLPDSSVDFISCFSTLHHIANVSAVVNESFRILKPGGWMVISEPVVSMGDWRLPRRGVTATERGIPREIMRGFLRSAGFSIEHETICSFPLTSRLASLTRFFGRRDVFNLRLAVELDRLLSRLTQWNYRYHRKNIWRKIAPSQMYFVITK